MSPDEVLFAKWVFVAFFSIPFAMRRSNLQTWLVYALPSLIILQVLAIDVFAFWFVFWAVFVMALSLFGLFGGEGSL